MNRPISRRTLLRGMSATLGLASAHRSAPGAEDQPYTDNRVQQNIIIITLDDVGVDQIPLYRTHFAGKGHALTYNTSGTNWAAATPTIKKLADAGVAFENAWSSPVCSPTRACMYTGQHCFRHGVYRPDDDPVLPASSVTYAQATRAAGYANGLFGKWHVGGDSAHPCGSAPSELPLHFGWDQFAGFIGGGVGDYGGDPDDSASWKRVFRDASGGRSCTDSGKYVTTQIVTDALAWIKQQARNGKPWTATVNFPNPHSPYTELAPDDDPARLRAWTDAAGRKRAVYRSLLESADRAIKALLDDISSYSRAELENTVIMLAGDNGTPSDITDHFLHAGKDNVDAGGTHVPLIVAGGFRYLHPGSSAPLVGPGDVKSPGRWEQSLVGTIDVFSTCVSIAGGNDCAGWDSVSLLPYLQSTAALPQRAFLFTESRTAAYDALNPTSRGWDVAAAARDSVNGYVFKLILRDYSKSLGDSVDGTAGQELYNVLKNPWQGEPITATGDNLLSGTSSAYFAAWRNKLKNQIASILASGPICT